MNVSNDNSGNGERDDALLRALRRLPREIAPRRDLWAGIADALYAHPAQGAGARGTPAGRRLLRWPYALAAGLGCMALGALLTIAVLRTQPSIDTAAAAEPSLYSEASFGGYQALGPEYESARATLAIGLAERIDRLPPEAQQKIERNLDEIRRALREINVALALDPNSILLQQLLLSTYQSELALLANVNQMAGNIPARTES